jgi:2-phosphoglycerate kinase
MTVERDSGWRADETVPPPAGERPAEREPIVISDKRFGLPYSKGLMAQSFMATGLSPAKSYDAARTMERAMRDRGELTVTLGRLRELATDTLRGLAGETYAVRYRRLEEINRLDRPLIVIIGGTTGVGKSTVAAEIAHRLGITRIASTDSIRQVMRGIFSEELMPAIYESSFNAWRSLRIPAPQGADPVIVGFREQAAVVATGIKALIDRSVTERVSMVIEGVHIVPGYIEPSQFENAWVVQLIITVDDEEAHRSHFYIREVQTDGTRPFEKYRQDFGAIRLLGHYIEDLAKEHGTPIIHSHELDRTVSETLEHILSAVMGDVDG